MNKCLVCDRVIEDNFNSIFKGYSCICYECLKKFKIRNDKFKMLGVKGIILYYYDEFFKDILYRYKGRYDYALKDVFLGYNLQTLKRKFNGYSLVLAPSNEEAEMERGFCHLEAVFNALKLPIVKCFYKCEEWKQSDKSISEREKVQNVIKIDKSKLNGIKKVLIVDDVLTSGSTIKAMISQIPSSIAKKVLVLSSNCRIKTNEIV